LFNFIYLFFFCQYIYNKKKFIFIIIIIKSDKWNRKSTEIVAIDANFYSPGEKYEQFSKKELEREINKLYAGFKDNEYSSYQKGSFIATGNWGNLFIII